MAKIKKRAGRVRAEKKPAPKPHLIDGVFLHLKVPKTVKLALQKRAKADGCVMNDVANAALSQYMGV